MNGRQSGPESLQINSSMEMNGFPVIEHSIESETYADIAPEPVTDSRHKAGCFGCVGGCFQSCHPDPDEKSHISYDNIQDNSCVCQIPKLYLRFNPIVTVLSVAVIWGFVAWCMVYPEESAAIFRSWKREITDKFSWFYVGTQYLWVIFVAGIYFSKYSDIKLGKDDDVPEYNAATWFAMMFSCGVGAGFFFFSVSEPIMHYDYNAGGGNRYIADGHMSDNTLAQWAINLTLFHWGIHGWVVYCIVGMLIGIMGHRLGLPLTIKSCFYPLIGKKIFGWMGDVVDSLAIVTTLLGVCTSLGLAAIQLNTRLSILTTSIQMETIVQVIIVWCITALATASSLSGISLGIRRLSELCFVVGLVVMLIVMLLDDTRYILNLYIQSLGFYLQWILQLGFHTDAFELSGPSHGGTDRLRAYEDGSKDGPYEWMESWTIFYWGWWIAWSPFVGLFVAQISKGRTVRELILGTIVVPVFYIFLWFSVFGGIGLRMERESAGVGLCCTANISRILQCHNNSCSSCDEGVMNLFPKIKLNTTEYLLDKHFGSRLPDGSLTRLSCDNHEEMWFHVLSSYGYLNRFLPTFSLVAIILYFVTTSDSASYLVDSMAANGEEDPPRVQRFFWSVTEGATATALLIAGGGQVLEALQTVSVAAGWMFSFIICFMCVSLGRVFIIDQGHNATGPQFEVGLLDVIASPTCHSVGHVILNTIIAPYTVARAFLSTSCMPKSKQVCKIVFCTLALSGLLTGFVILEVMSIWHKELWAIGVVFYLAFGCIVGFARREIRRHNEINGHIMEDIFCGTVFYPLTVFQISKNMRSTRSESNGLNGHLRTYNGVQNPSFMLP